MKFFLCAVGEITLALPADFAAKIIPVTRDESVLMETESGSGDVYLSLPLVFRKGKHKQSVVCRIRHGIVLKRCPEELLAALGRKPSAGPIGRGSPPEPARVILSTPRIETDLDIPDGDIRPLPVFLGQPELLPFLSGAVFTGAAMILIVDMELLLKKISVMAQETGND